MQVDCRVADAYGLNTQRLIITLLLKFVVISCFIYMTLITHRLLIA